MVRKLAITLPVLLLAGLVLAQGTTTIDPSTWFDSTTTIFAAAALITPWIVNIVTALGKDWFSTSGKATQWLSFAVSIIIAGVGGWMSLGFLAGEGGFTGLWKAVILVAIAFLGSNGIAKNHRQVAESTANRIVAKQAAVAALPSDVTSGKTSAVIQATDSK